MDIDQSLLDLYIGKMVANRAYPLPYGSNVRAWRTDNRVIYDYISPTNIHRVGSITTQPAFTHVYQDYAESITFFAYRQELSPDSSVLPIITYDQVDQSQTVTLYTASTLTALASLTQSPVIVPQSIADGAHLIRTSWSPDSNWFWFPTPTAAKITMTALSPRTGQSISFPLSGDYEDRLPSWTSSGNAVAIFGGNGNYVDIFATDNGDWTDARHFQLNADASKDRLNVDRWSEDQQTLFLQKYINVGVTSTPQVQYLTFSLATESLEANDPVHSNPTAFHFSDTWLCAPIGDSKQYELVSLSGDYAPITLATKPNQYFSPCYLVEDSTRTRLILPTRLSLGADSTWMSLSVSPYALTPISLPSTASHVLRWLDHDTRVLFFVPAPDNPTESGIGQLGIFDLKTQRSLIFPDAIATDLSYGLSPDATRLTVTAADRQRILLYTLNGELLATLPAPNMSLFHANWSPDSSRFVLPDDKTLPSPAFIITMYDRNGQPITSTYHPSVFTIGSDGWTHCEPAPKFPRLNLPP
ncbi:MAG: hypothetical protein KF716_00515 [Anaerolineae bacterium]|nr:hypothetical protein [Anaerolineae bacterium]